MTGERPLNVLVTGATGFVGSHVLSKLSTCNMNVIATTRSDVIEGQGRLMPRWIKFDLDDRLSDADLPVKPDILIHLAWGGLPNYKSTDHTGVELTRQKAFLRNAIDFGIKNIFVAGTCFEYGMVEGKLSEERVPAPHTEYGKAKVALFEELSAWQRETPFNLTWGRLFYLYGRGQGERSLYTLVQAAIARGDTNFAMSPGDQQRDFLPIEETAKHIVDLALLRRDLGAVNICSGDPVSITDIVSQWLDEAGVTMELETGVYPYADYEAMHFWGDNAKLKHVLSAM